MSDYDLVQCMEWLRQQFGVYSLFQAAHALRDEEEFKKLPFEERLKKARLLFERAGEIWSESRAIKSAEEQKKAQQSASRRQRYEAGIGKKKKSA